MKNGWDAVWTPYAGASDSYQSFYKNDVRIGRVHGWESDGDYGYNAFKLEPMCEVYIGNYETRKAAQEAVEWANR